MGWKTAERLQGGILISPKPMAGIVACLLLVGGCWFVASGINQHRADYPGGLTFVGHAEGLFGTRYERLYMWKSPDYTDALPSLTCYIDGRPYPIAEFTPDLMLSLHGTLNEGGLWDSQGNILQYRFQNSRLTYLSLYPTGRPPEFNPSPEAVGNVYPGVFQISLNGGEPFALPMTHRDVVHLAGPPSSAYWYFSN